MKKSNTKLSNEKKIINEAEQIVDNVNEKFSNQPTPNTLHQNKEILHIKKNNFPTKNRKKMTISEKNYTAKHGPNIKKHFQNTNKTLKKSLPNSSFSNNKKISENKIKIDKKVENLKTMENRIEQSKNIRSTSENLLDIPNIQPQNHNTQSESQKKNSELAVVQKKDENNGKASKTTAKKAHKKSIILKIIILVIILTLLILSFIFGFITSKSNKIISGVSINGIDISNLTKDEATEKLSLQLKPNMASEISLVHGEYTKSLDPSTLNSKLNIEDSINAAFLVGRSEGNVFLNNFRVITTYFKKQNVSIEATYDQEELNNIVNTINEELPDKVVNSSYKIEENNLIVENSSNGYKVDPDKLSKLITNSIINNVKTIELPVERFEAESVDIEEIYNELCKEAVNASYTKDPYEIQKEEDGLDFAISLDEAKKIAMQDSSTFTIPLKVLKPTVTVKDLPQEAFPDLLGTYSTSYATSNANRSTNISLATKSVDGVVLMPDEVFSYNNTLGQRTPERGYKEAGVYVNGEVSTDYGGGICQVSSTLYNATLLSNLEIVARTNHYFQPGYVPSGQDATVSWGAPDFQFKNNRSYPIRIVATANGATLAVSIYGLKTSDDYTVKIQSNQVATIPFTTQYKDDSTLPAGTTKVIQAGSNGCKTETYKILYKNGTEVSRTRVSADTYQPHNQIIARGTATPAEDPNTNTNTNQNSTGTSGSGNTSNTVTSTDSSFTITF